MEINIFRTANGGWRAVFNNPGNETETVDAPHYPELLLNIGLAKWFDLMNKQ